MEIKKGFWRLPVKREREKGRRGEGEKLFGRSLERERERERV